MIKPLGNRIFLKKDEQPEKKGDIILLKKDGMYAPPYAGTIIGIGDEVKDKEYQIGTKVLFHDLAGIEFQHKEETIFSLRERDITAIILDKNVQVI
jgi:co-chaperonin GroES (HSP10)|tara:strand:+ start:572 stop:859 length:288 start_codon:yes stop_codon:yes gene_type:complete